MPKRYRSTFLLGQRSETDDIESTCIALPEARRPTSEEIASAARGLVGTIQQRPPTFSAIKVQGRRSYDLARRGVPVDLAPRSVTIFRLDVLEYEYPRLVVDIECSGGTYVRAIGRDLAAALGTAAVMSALERTAVGRFCVEEAASLEQLKSKGVERWLLPPLAAVDSLRKLRCDDGQIALISQGRQVAMADVIDGEEYAIMDGNGNLRAIAVGSGSVAILPHRVFHSQAPGA
jgi:tRNA pseudouridine55 synthase